MNFEEAHIKFIQYHMERRTGERKGRLERGHKHAEIKFLQNIWWVLRGNFDNLHPEYEIKDWRGISYFCDFAWITAFVKLIIEIKGFGPHVRDTDRHKYSNELNRETFLSGIGYQVVSFSYDDIKDNPETCISLLRLVLSRYQPNSNPISLDNLAEREIIRLAMQLSGSIRPIDVEKHIGVGHRKAVTLLQSLSEKSLLTPVAGEEGKHIVKYDLQYHSDIGSLF